jgi:hypothetical protein
MPGAYAGSPARQSGANRLGDCGRTNAKSGVARAKRSEDFDEHTARRQRDLSLVLDRAIQTGRVVVLQHHELRTLARLPGLGTSEQQFAELRWALAHGSTTRTLERSLSAELREAANEGAVDDVGQDGRHRHHR